jgi:hypothetical protein
MSHDEVAVVSVDESVVSRGGDWGGSTDEGASGDESSRTYYFGASTITLDRIREMVEKGYFVEGEERAAREETTPDQNVDGAIVFEEFLLLVYGCLRTLR